MGEARTASRFEQLARAEAVEVFRIRALDVSVLSQATPSTAIVSFELPGHHRGYLTAVGHETTRVGFNSITWALVTADDLNTITRGVPRQIRGFGNQVGLQWGRIAAPGEVFGDLPHGTTVALVATQESGSAILADGIIVGYYWPVDDPGEPK